jgi:hypothetical protein
VIYKPSDYLFHVVYKPSDCYFQMPVEPEAFARRCRPTPAHATLFSLTMGGGLRGGKSGI